LELPGEFCEKSGLRISPKEVVNACEMALCGTTNKRLSSLISSFGGSPLGLSGRDCHIFKCRPIPKADGGAELYNVGDVFEINTEPLHRMLEAGFVPVLAPIGTSGGDANDEQIFNINADSAAGVLARKIGAHGIIFLTDIKGVLSKEMELFNSLSTTKLEDLISDETITAGMIPKVRYASFAVEGDEVKKAVIADGRVEFAVRNVVWGELMAGKEETKIGEEWKSEGGGTLIYKA